jgi:hypothetical protein
MDGQAGSYLGSSTVISGSSAQSDVFEATDDSRVRPVSKNNKLVCGHNRPGNQRHRKIYGKSN